MKSNHIVSIFGGTGDLTYRKLLPAFYNLTHRQQLPEDFHIVIIGRRDYTSESYRETLKPWILEHSRCDVDPQILETFLQMVSYFKMTFTESDDYPALKDYFDTLNPDAKKLYYFAVSPSFFEVIATHLAENNLNQNAKIIIEKPFGNDLESAIQINNTLTQYFQEDDIYRIDHYIAKEMVQNIFTIRFANEIFKRIWDQQSIANIQITAAETVGVENRGNFYEQTGALKDMFQNHLLQILSIVTMEEPDSFDAYDIHKRQEDVLEKIIIENINEDVVFGQYQGDEDHLSYRQEQDVASDSTTETFVALKLGIDNERFRNVPIYVRTGKRMHKRATEIVVEFKDHMNTQANVLIIKIQPDEGVYFKFNIKKPGSSNESQAVFMDFCQSCDYENRQNTPEAYERLLEAALVEDHTLFASFKQVQLSWKLAEKILKEKQDRNIQPYKVFSNGPQAAFDLLEKDGFSWIEESVLGELQYSKFE